MHTQSIPALEEEKEEEEQFIWTLDLPPGGRATAPGGSPPLAGEEVEQ